jgi:cytochrome c-type biogenesis protein CcmH
MWRCCLLLLCLTGPTAWAVIDTHEFESDVQRLRYHSFIDEMRCPKCQNQNLSGSDSPIAMDLRRELYDMIQDGRSDKEIVDFMVERYGDYILYRPRVTPVTFLLWFGPVVLLLVGLVVLIVIVRQRRRVAVESAPQALSAGEQAHLADLLKSADKEKDKNSHDSSSSPRNPQS